LSVGVACSIRVPFSSQPVRRLRGGADLEEEDLGSILDDDPLSNDEDADAPSAPASAAAAAAMPEKKALTREEIIAKLNHIPVFCIVNEEGQMVGLQDKDSGVFACCWFTDPDEAKMLLGATVEANPDKALKLVVAGMGGAFLSCKGFPDGDAGKNGEVLEGLKTTTDDKVELRLQGSHALVAELKPKLKDLLEKAKIDAGCWQLPVFLCEELQSNSICPVFIHPADLAATWEKAGRDPEKLPENLTVMDLRMLVAAMSEPTNAWSVVEFIGSSKAADLALEVGKDQAGA